MVFPPILGFGAWVLARSAGVGKGEKVISRRLPPPPLRRRSLLDESPRSAALPARSRPFAVRRCGAVRCGPRARTRAAPPPAGGSGPAPLPADGARRAALRGSSGRSAPAGFQLNLVIRCIITFFSFFLKK